MSNEIIVQLATGVYDGTTIITFPDGHTEQAYVKSFNEVEIIFDADGVAWLNQANIARLFGIDKRNMGSAIETIEKLGFLGSNEHVILLMTSLDSGRGTYDREIPFYDQYVMNLLAARMQKPSQQAIDYLEWRESIFRKHQYTVHQLRLQAMREQGLLAEQVESLTETVTEAQKAEEKARYWEWKQAEQARYLVAELRGELPIENWTE